jgi:hypothetical protein
MNRWIHRCPRQPRAGVVPVLQYQPFVTASGGHKASRSIGEGRVCFAHRQGSTDQQRTDFRLQTAEAPTVAHAGAITARFKEARMARQLTRHRADSRRAERAHLSNAPSQPSACPASSCFGICPALLGTLRRGSVAILQSQAAGDKQTHPY